MTRIAVMLAALVGALHDWVCRARVSMIWWCVRPVLLSARIC